VGSVNASPGLLSPLQLSSDSYSTASYSTADLILIGWTDLSRGCGSCRAVGIVDPVNLHHVVVDKLKGLKGRVVQQEDVPVAVVVAAVAVGL
jgi:hypothetical protein